MIDSLGPLTVGILLPNDAPLSGGGYNFQQSILAEILKRIRSSRTLEDGCMLQYRLIAFDLKSVLQWGLNKDEVILIRPSISLRFASWVHQFFRRLPLRSADFRADQTLIDCFIFSFLSRRVHVLWSLSPLILTDQIPFIISIWDLQHRLQPFFPEVSRNGEWEARENYFSVSARKAFLAVVGTHRGLHELTSFYGVDPSRILVNPFPCPIPLHIPFDKQSDLLQALSLDSGRYLLYPAQFWTHKNHLLTLIVLRKLIDRGFLIKIVFTGSDKGSLEAVLSTAERLGLSQWVVNAGFVDREFLSALYHNAYALIYPSFFGPDNLPPLEAMSHGLPALVADVPGSLEQYGDAVLRFDPGDPDQAVQQILRLESEKGLRNRLKENGFKLVERLTVSAYVDNVESEMISSSLSLHCAFMA